MIHVAVEASALAWERAFQAETAIYKTETGAELLGVLRTG